MSNLITIVSATPFEIAPLKSFLDEEFELYNGHIYQQEPLNVELLITGVGMVQTAYSLGKYLCLKQPGLLIQAGIAGALNTELAIGDVVQVSSEEFADLGVEEADGSFTDVHELDLISPDQPPFRAGKLLNPGAGEFDFLPSVKGITVNKVHGSDPSIEKLKKRSDADVESMEGAAFFYACLREKRPFLQLRSISNYVEARKRENWNVPLAIENLNQVLKEMILSLCERS
jgi:futalosine hydrolase